MLYFSFTDFCKIMEFSRFAHKKRLPRISLLCCLKQLKGTKDKAKRPKGPTTGSWGLESHETFPDI